MKRVLLLVSLPVILVGMTVAQDTKPEPCPDLTVFGPSSNLEINRTGKYSALIDMKGVYRELSYKWSVVGGEIISGQGTTDVEVKKTDKVLHVQINVDGFRPRCNNVASYAEQITVVPDIAKLDLITDPIPDIAQDRLMNIVTEMRAHPGQILWIYLGYNSKVGKNPARGSRAEEIMNALRKERFGHDERVIFVDIESDHEFVEFWRSTSNTRPPRSNSN